MGYKLDLFMKHGPYVDYPFEEVMFRWDAQHEYMLQKHYGSDSETIVGWSGNLLNEMLAHGGAQPLTAEEYDLGKQVEDTYPTADTYRAQRLAFPFHQALYLNTALSCEAFAEALGLICKYRSKAPVVDWVWSSTTPETSVQVSAETGIHPAAEGQISPDLEVFWNDDDEGVADNPGIYEFEIDLLLKSIRDRQVTGGLYVANSAKAVWWTDTDGVTVTSDPEVLSSMPGQQIAPALQAAGIEYRNA